MSPISLTARQGAEGKSRYYDKTISFYPFWNG